MGNYNIIRALEAKTIAENQLKITAETKINNISKNIKLAANNGRFQIKVRIEGEVDQNIINALTEAGYSVFVKEILEAESHVLTINWGDSFL